MLLDSIVGSVLIGSDRLVLGRSLMQDSLMFTYLNQRPSSRYG